MNIQQFGWSEYWATQWNEWKQNTMGQEHTEWQPARIIADYGQKVKLVTQHGECWGVLSGRLRHETLDEAELPAVGDWVAAAYVNQTSDAIIQAVLPRKSRISRQAAGFETREQLIATNVDTLFLVNALNKDFNLRRLERYLIMAWNSGVDPVIVLSKSDLCPEPALLAAEAEAVAPGVPIIVISALEDRGKEDIEAYLQPGCTVALTGSSGSGKSTIVNWLADLTLQQTQDVREADSRGRHTTTHRQMFPILQDAVLIDTPGMRELNLWDDNTGGVANTFADIEEIAQGCRFADCKHQGEQGCALEEAIIQGLITVGRLNNYRKMQRELEFQSRKEAERKRKDLRTNTMSKSVKRTGWRHDMD